MAHAGTVQPKVFVSSVYREPAVPGSGKHLAIRRTIRDMAAGAGIDAWIAEYSAKGLETKPWTEIVDTCIDNLLDSQIFVAVLYSRAGGLVGLGTEYGFATASVFEIELFYASLHLKPAFFFVVRGYLPEPELDNLIRLLRLCEAEANWFVGTESEIEARMRELFAALARGENPSAPLPNFCDLTSEYKSFRNIAREIHSEKLSLIGRFAPVDAGDYEQDRIDHLLTLAKDAQSRTARFSRLWMALRELCKSPFDGADRAASAQWLEFARQLPSVAAWLGLHGPLNIGVSAAYHTQNALRRHGLLAADRFPYGAFASESYSIGINHARPVWKRLRFRAAERLATRHAELHSHDPSGALAIRGSARLRLARLGAPWLVWSALSDFRRACEIKEKLGADDSAMGEALLNRGLAEYAASGVLRYKRRSALDMMREGVRLMETNKNPARIGFIVSAKRKLADTLNHSGLHDEARIHREEATALAKEFGIIGQLGRLRAEGS